MLEFIFILKYRKAFFDFVVFSSEGLEVFVAMPLCKNLHGFSTSSQLLVGRGTDQQIVGSRRVTSPILL